MNRVFSAAQRLGAQTRRAFSSSVAEASESTARRQRFAAAAAGGLVLGGSVLFLDVALASGDNLGPAEYPWSENANSTSFDAASLRRGYEVYRNICATCHSMEYIHFRDLVGVTHTEEQAKALAATFKYMEGPNDKGEFVERPGRLFDVFKSPFKNEEHARYANGGAYPPDLSCIIKARKNGPDYVFALLTGYKKSPAGINLREGLHYNPYFAGGAISMAKALNDGGLEYEDGTPATESQMAKDVTTFLTWCSEPHTDERKRFGLQAVTVVALCLLGAVYGKRFAWNVYKTKKFTYTKNPSEAADAFRKGGGDGGH